MIRYILIDDDPKILNWVKTKIDTISKDFGLKHIQSYSSSKKAFEEVHPDDYDLLLVDFDMPVYNGIELAQKIGTNKKIVFLTSTTNNGPKMMNALNVSGYLSKPFDIEEFKLILKNKVIGNINPIQKHQKADLISIRIGTHKDIGFYPEKAYYISTSRNIKGKQAHKNCVNIYGKNDEVIESNVRISINDFYKKLSPFGFEKINQSTIINVSKIKNRDNKHLNLHNCQETFLIADQEKAGFITKMRTMFGI
ncbi:LytR/AlgR family response regulator transcription factor [Xanthomarina sp. F2636L]|uniref:LytR/AlgR family response regulator transcription factor n=1 Tax=Xanthomarina sp. F2636L TaxID=2996018 RepID=UPI00225DE497|nr:response regulator [Xanthomarina sp. F2636L]MCX7550282.1 response regulator [Xanthomarina sp. F2636L]